jgi:MFS family permease
MKGLKFNRVIKALLFADIIWFFGEGMLGPLFAIFAERIGGDILEITGAWATYLIVSGILIVVVGKISDKVNKRKLVFYGYILNAILTFGYLLVDTPFKLLIVQAGLGLAAALATPTWNAFYSEHEAKTKDGTEWGLADGISQLFTGIAIILGGFIVVNFSFTTLFVTMGIIQVISVLALIPILRNK